MDLAWLTGNVPADHLRRTRPSYYARLIAQTPPAAAEPPHAAEADHLDRSK